MINIKVTSILRHKLVPVIHQSEKHLKTFYKINKSIEKKKKNDGFDNQ